MLKNTILLFFILIFSNSVDAKIWKVDDTGYTTPTIGGTLTLPMAIGAASANDTILINISGTMIVAGPNLVFDKPLTIIGPEAIHFTIDVNSWQVIFDIPAGIIYLEGIRFTSLPFLCGDYISIQQGTNLSIRNCVFEGTQITGNGGAIKMMHTSAMNVENSSFFNCLATGNGGAIYIGNSNTAVIRNCTFFNNSAFEGGAIQNDGNVTLVNNTFLNNTSTNNSGHAVKDGNIGAGTVTRVQNNIFTDVSAPKLADLLAGNIGDMWVTDGGNVYTNGGEVF